MRSLRNSAFFALWLLIHPILARAAFQTTTSLPEGFHAHTTLASNGYLYKVGGIGWDSGILGANTVYYSQIQSDGTLGPWQATTALPAMTFYHTGAVSNGYLYVLGGDQFDFSSGFTLSNKVYYSQIQSDGTLGAWIEAVALPQAVLYPSASSWNNTIYITGGLTETSDTNAVYFASVNSDGSISPWQATTPLPTAVYTHTAVQNNTLYVIGGAINNGATIVNTVLCATILSDKTLGPWTPVTALPTPLQLHSSQIWGNSIYVTGGIDGINRLNNVFTNAIQSDGTLGPWLNADPMPQALQQHSATVANGYLYITGGSNGTESQSTVYYQALPSTVPVIVDVQPPRTTLAVGAPNYGAAPQFVTPATQLTLSAVDDLTSVGDGAGLGVQSTQWAIDSGAFTSYTNPVTLGPDGFHWFRFYSIDTTGNSEAGQAVQFAVDGTAPISSATIGSPQAVSGSGQIIVSPLTQLSVSAYDPATNGVASGIAQVLAAIDSAPLAPFLGNFQLPGVDGAHTVGTQAIDHLQNTETAHQITVFMDATSPATTLQATPAPYIAPNGTPILGAVSVLSFDTTDPVINETASGVHHTEAGLDGGSLQTSNGTITLSEGTHQIQYRSIDNVGNQETVHSTNYGMDLTPPISTLQISTPSAQTPNGILISVNSDLTLSAADPASNGLASGVARIYYNIDGGSQQIYAAPLHLPLGSHTLNFHAEDNTGNAEAPQSVSFYVNPVFDVLPPRTTLSVGAPQFTSSSTFITPATPLQLAAIDDAMQAGDGAGIGVQITQWALDNDPFNTYQGNINIATDGLYWLRYFSTDLLGNSEAGQATQFAVDGTTPISTVTIGSPQAVLASGDVIIAPQTQLSVSAYDPVVNSVASGVSQLLVGVGGTAMSEPAGAFQIPGTDGAHTLRFQAADHLQNTESIHETVVLMDATPPVTTVEVTPAPYISSGIPILGAASLISFNAQDPIINSVAAGLDHTEYSVNGGNWTTVAGSLDLEEGVHVVGYRSLDNVGNTESTRSAAYWIDATAPISELSASGGSGGTLFGVEIVTSNTLFSISAEDPVSNGVTSGVASIVYSIDGGSDQIYTAAFSLPAGNHTIRFGAVDLAGNAEDRNEASVSVGASLFTDAVAALRQVELKGRARINGNVRSNGVVDLDGTSMIDGNVTAMEVHVSRRSDVTGTITEGQQTLPTSPLDLGAARAWAQANNNNNSIPSRLMNHGAFIADSRDRFTFEEGTYYLEGLKISGGADIRVSGTVTLFVHGPISITGRGTLNESGDSDDLWIAMDTPENVALAGNSRATFNLYAPSAPVSLNGHDQYAGHLWADSVFLAGKALQASTVSLPRAKHRRHGPKHLVRRRGEHRNEMERRGHHRGREDRIVSNHREVRAPEHHSHGNHSIVARHSPRPELPSMRRSETHSHTPISIGSSLCHLQPTTSGQSHGTQSQTVIHGKHNGLTISQLHSQAPLPALVAQSVVPDIPPAAPPAPKRHSIEDPPPAAQAHSSFVPRAHLPSVASMARIARNGGHIEVERHASIDIPEGATNAGLNVTVSRKASEDREEGTRKAKETEKNLTAVSAGTQFGPEGTKFDKPVVITLAYDRNLIPEETSEDHLTIHYWNPDKKDWEPFESTVDRTHGTVSAQTNHFSLYQVMAGATNPSASISATLTLGQVYAFPNPAKNGANPVLHIEAGSADSLTLRIFDISGHIVHSVNLSGPAGAVDDGSGRGPLPAFEYTWDVSGVGSGVYIYVATAAKSGAASVTAKGKVVVVK